MSIPGPSGYQLRPGTVAYRVHAWLEAQGSGFEATPGQIASALDLDAACLVSNISAAVDHGLLSRRTPSGQKRPWFYRLASRDRQEQREPAGDAGAPAAAANGHHREEASGEAAHPPEGKAEETGGTPKDAARKTGTRKPRAASAAAVDQALAPPGEEGLVGGFAPAFVPDPPKAFRAGMFTDGGMVIEKGRSSIELTREEVLEIGRLAQALERASA